MLKDQSLFKYKAYINGDWIDSDRSFDVTNPADGKVLASVPDLGIDETLDAITSASKAFKKWKKTKASKRSRILRKWYELILQHEDDLALLMTLEQGKPMVESKGEVKYGASFVEWFAEEAKRIYGDVIPTHKEDARVIVIKQPIGVVAAITPWNFPNAMITRKVAPALAAGCTVVIKPSEETPLSALALAELAERAGFPPGVLNVITTYQASEVGKVLTGHSAVRKISFTGSTEVGKILMKQSADSIKKVSLELGGNAPFIVFDDADLDSAVRGAITAKYRNTGQTCICANRIYVQETVYDEFVNRYTEEVRKQRIGVGTDEGISLGPLINEDAIEKVERLVTDAIDKGAIATTGGRRHEMGGLFYEPTVLKDVTMDMACAREEIFGPVAPIYKFSTENEVVSMANDTNYGLAAYFYARDLGRVWRVAEELEYGMIGINDGFISTASAPFGGVKESGIGREGSKYGMDEFVEIKYMLMGGLG